MYMNGKQVCESILKIYLDGCIIIVKHYTSLQIIIQLLNKTETQFINLFDNNENI